MPESYKPGRRTNQYNKNRQFDASRYVWLSLEDVKLIVLVGNEKSPHGPDVVINMPQAGRKVSVNINLTNLTIEELNSLREILNTALDWAQPVVELRDKEAQDARNTGDDSYSRLYRAVPSVVYRKRPLHEHDASVLGRYAPVPGTGGDDGDDGELREPGDDLAEHDTGDGGTQDDGKTPHLSEGIRAMGFQPELPPLGVRPTDSGEDDPASDS